ncbi:hypothetical protein UFOVP328_85 [uncultured Caudovirales phage]|uniref:Uncharacterized protein n=1 Tax=uncultured Caudovirales phage TaxID=2100421 RepID=A0A6J5LYH7_9CAUD|nr:hypothetical protein UFOVP328_85 [uncultured Caudovirales phage]
MPNSQITFTVKTNDPAAGLGFEVWLDNQQVFDSAAISDTVNIAVAVVDDDQEHALKMVLKGKLPTHTCVDSQGNIVSDAVLEITDLAVDGIMLSYLVDQFTVYSHNFNGTGADVQDRFFGTMGCNGTAELRFSAPIYVWLLENM